MTANSKTLKKPLRKSVGTSGTVINYPYLVKIDDKSKNQAAYEWLGPKMKKMGISGCPTFCWGWDGQFRFHHKELATAFALEWGFERYGKK